MYSSSACGGGFTIQRRTDSLNLPPASEVAADVKDLRDLPGRSDEVVLQRAGRLRECDR